MFSTIDRYLIRQTIAPFLLALGIFTFVLAVHPALDTVKLLLAKGVGLGTVGKLLLLMLPSSLALTIPMAFLTGLLMATGRISADRESVALLACGISPLRLLRPILAMGLIAGGLDMYVLMRATPDANEEYRNIAFQRLTELTSADIKPRVFFTQFPGKVLFIRDIAPDGGWAGVLLADTTEPGRPNVTTAESGRLLIDRDHRLVRLVLERATKYEPGRTDQRVYSVSRLLEPAVFEVKAESVFGTAQTVPGLREKRYAELRHDIDEKRAAGQPPHVELMQQQQMFSFPAACLIFAVVALPIGINTRKEGRLAGLTLGLGVILIYYAVMAMAEGWTKGVASAGQPVEAVALAARWIPNVVLGLIGALALWRQTQAPGRRDLSIRLPSWTRRAALQEPDPPKNSAPHAAGRPVVQLKAPRLDFAVPRLLDRYVARRFLTAVSLAFLGLLSLYYIGAFVDLADKLFKQQAGGKVFASFLIHSTPQFVVFVIPVATLMAGLATIGGLTRSNELVVMRACGVSLYRVALPLVGFALGGSVVLFALEERVLGEANRIALELRDTMRDRRPGPAAVMVSNQNWLAGEDGRIYAYAAFGTGSRLNASQPTIQGLSVFDTVTGPYRLRAHLFAARARFGPAGWVAEHGWSEQFTGGDAVRREFVEEPVWLPAVQDFRRSQVDPSTMTFREYREYVRKLGASGFNVAEQRVNLYRKIAFPMVTIVMMLLAVPFGVTVGRKGALYGIGLGTILAGGYFLLMTFFMAAGAAGLLPPMLAAWGANLLFGAGALYLVLTVRT